MKNHYKNFDMKNKGAVSKECDSRFGNLLLVGMLLTSITFGPNNVEAASPQAAVTKESKDKQVTDANHSNEMPEYRNPFDQLSKEMDRLWHKISIRDNSGYIIDGAFASSNFYSYLNNTDKEYILNIEIPGFEKEQVKIELQGDYIIVKAQKPQINSSKNNDAYSNAQSRNSLYQKLLLPKDVDKSAISSSLKNGILTITLPKSPIKTEEVKVIPIS